MPDGSGSEVRVLQLEARWSEVRDAWGRYQLAVADRKTVLKEYSERIAAVASALELLLREPKHASYRVAFDEAAKFQAKIDKLAAEKESKAEWHKNVVAKRLATVNQLLSDGAEQLPLLLPDMTLSSDLYLEETLLCVGDLVRTGAVPGVTLRVVGFRTEGEGDGRQEVVVMRKARDDDGYELQSTLEHLERAAAGDKDTPTTDAEPPTDPKLYGGLCIPRRCRPRRSSGTRPRRRYAAGSQKVLVLWSGAKGKGAPVDPNNLELVARAKVADAAPPKRVKYRVGDRVLMPDDRPGEVIEIVDRIFEKTPAGKNVSFPGKVRVLVDGLKTAKTVEAVELRREPRKRKGKK